VLPPGKVKPPKVPPRDWNPITDPDPNDDGG